jgi:hypothetical protein
VSIALRRPLPVAPRQAARARFVRARVVRAVGLDLALVSPLVQGNQLRCMQGSSRARKSRNCRKRTKS